MTELMKNGPLFAGFDDDLYLDEEIGEVNK
jgi:hypothetical protein